MEKKGSPKTPPKSPAETPSESLDEPSLPQPDPEPIVCPASVPSTAVESSAALGQEELRSQHPYPQLFGWGASSSSGRAPLPAPELSTADVIKPLLFCQPMTHVYPRVRGRSTRPSMCFTRSVSLPGQEKPALRQGSSRRRGISRSVSFMIDESPDPREGSTCRGNGQSASLPGQENPSLNEVSSSQGMGCKHAATFSSLQSGSRKSVFSFEGISFESALQGTKAVSSAFKSPEGSVPAPSTADLPKGSKGHGQKKPRGRKPAMKFGKGATGTRIPVSGGQSNRSTPGSLMAGEGIHGDPGQAALAAQENLMAAEENPVDQRRAGTSVQEIEALRMEVRRLKREVQSMYREVAMIRRRSQELQARAILSLEEQEQEEEEEPPKKKNKEN